MSMYAVFMWLYTVICLLYEFISFLLSLQKEINVMARNQKDGK